MKNIKKFLKLVYLNEKKIIYQNVRKNDKKKIIRFFILKIAIIIFFIIFYFQNSKLNKKINKTRYDINFDYSAYENNVITTKILENSGWQLGGSQPYFINGLIRKHKPKNCLEIGVANGGSSILILNAIKDIPNSSLISLDKNTQVYNNQFKKTGYRVNQYFPDLTKNWKLFTGQQPHKFLIELNMKICILGYYSYCSWRNIEFY
jgi:hypothetical protein